jgi:endonuclease/exonuclease/phosphatase family metal-dependent hydrolase
MKLHHSGVLFALTLALAACRTGINYPGLSGPRFTGAVESSVADSSAALRVVSFNIKYAQRVDSAISVLTSEAALQNADIILLQEMDESGTKQIADTLGMSFVYYPATFHIKHQKHFGNAVLSRWPIVADEKLVLPHIARFTRTQRIATAATVRVHESLVRVYSTHLGTPADVGPGSRREQLSTILKDASGFDRVVIGGDFNNHGVGKVARDSGYAWPTEKGPRTMLIGRWDHIVFKGLMSPDSAGSGTIGNVRHASDHKPVWAVGVLK